MAGSGTEKEMSFWDHLEELRGTLFRSILAVCLFSVLGFIFKRPLFHVVLLPTSRTSSSTGCWAGLSTSN